MPQVEGGTPGLIKYDEDGPLVAHFAPGYAPSVGDFVALPLKDGTEVEVEVTKIIWHQQDDGSFAPAVHLGDLADDD
jgi:hypothetical protein